jgi:predicted  nucleic acid-binding Zn-ribbon protein
MIQQLKEQLAAANASMDGFMKQCATLQQERDAANARIAELERKVAAWEGSTLERSEEGEQ